MKKNQLSALISVLFVAAPAFAQSDDGPFRATGQVTAGGIVTDTNSKDPSKFEQYQDLNNGMLSNIGIFGRNNKSWIDAYGENFGRDDMYVNLRGGMYDVFRARAYTNWMPHNLLFNGLTPFTGAGTANLTAAFPQPNPAGWQALDLGFQRKDTGGMFEWQAYSPWYFRVEGNQVKQSGTKVGSGSNGTSPGSGFMDLPLPVQYETNNVTGEIGYATRAMTLSASYTVSNFNNANNAVFWNNGFWGNGVDTTYLPPENNYQRIALNATWRQLPWNSSLAFRYTWDQTKSDLTIGQNILNGVGIFTPVLPNTPVFNGDEKRQTFTAGWYATPVTNLETRAYFNWQKMNNDSTPVTFCPTNVSSCGGTVTNELWDYDKQNAGLDAYYRVNRGNRVGAGYDYNHIKQNRVDFDDTHTNTFWLEWRNTSFDNVTARLKYSYLNRSSDFLLGNDGANANDPAYLQRFVRAFDLANLTQNRVKFTADWSPADNWGLAAEYLYKDNNYKDTPLGRTGDTRNEVFLNVTYGMPTSWRMSLFADYEHIKYDSDHRNVGVGSCDATTGPNCFDPSSPPSSSSYNWTANVKNTNWLVGLGGDFPVTPKFMLTGSVMYEKVDGSSDMTSQNNFGNPLPLPNYPNVKFISLNLKGTYSFDRNWSMTGGYAYQKYKYSDDQFNGYTNTIPFPGTSAANSSQSYLDGWNANIPYNANIFYLLMTFKFDTPPLPVAQLKAPEAPPAARPVVPPPPAPTPPPPPPQPQVQKITLDSKVLFDFDKAVLKPEGKAAIDSQVIGNLAQIKKLEVVLVTGHTDRLGTDAHNQKLSVQRADAVRDYLVFKGVDKAKIETIGMGEKQPVVQCDQKNMKELIACLQPNRRVDVQVKGEK